MNKFILLFALVVFLPSCHGILDYLVNKNAFDQGLYMALDGTGVEGGTATLQVMQNRRSRIWNENGQTLQDSNTQANLCLDVFNENITSGATVGEWTCNGQNNQNWVFDTTTGWGAIHPASDLSLCLDASGQGTAAGTPVILWTCNGQTNQQWSKFSSG
eukprot:Phypoly_transcript_23610.p1 GENE.Phypoly_transcript_23610~~Phypoly_transcript_23610.p1  ORF type:complete len:167 (+),score=19.26 Phypoly_transcript_23610:26-502(+)